MIDMKVTEEEKKMNAQPSILNDTENYPYGLCIHLDSATFKKLGIPVPVIGQEFQMEAIVAVKALSAGNYKGDVNEVDVSLQIKSMVLEKPEDETKELEPAEEVIYKG